MVTQYKPAIVHPHPADPNRTSLPTYYDKIRQQRLNLLDEAWSVIRTPDLWCMGTGTQPAVRSLVDGSVYPYAWNHKDWFHPNVQGKVFYQHCTYGALDYVVPDVDDDDYLTTYNYVEDCLQKAAKYLGYHTVLDANDNGGYDVVERMFQIARIKILQGPWY